MIYSMQKTIIVLTSLLLFISGCHQKYNGFNRLITQKFNLESDSLVLVVKVKSTNYTDYHLACDGCIPWSYWYVHIAEVIEVVHGKYDNKFIRFAMLQHANFINEITDEWYLNLKVIENQNNIKLLGTKFYAVEHGSEFSLKLR